MTRNRWYWTLQVSGWFLYGLLGVSINAYFFGNFGIGLLYPILAAFLMMMSTHYVRIQMKSRGWLELKLPMLLLRVVPLFILFAVIVNLLNTWFSIKVTELFAAEEFSVPVFFLYVLQNTIYFMLWLGVYLVIHFFRNYKTEEVEKWKLESAVKDAELIALKAQINPHFLFNALNNIRALILEDQMKARDMLTNLSDLLRYSIQFSTNELVTIAEEMEIVKNYIELERIHYEERLQFEVELGDDLMQYRIPPMIIQLMVENAIKHGISEEKDGGIILLKLFMRDSLLWIEVKNTGKLGSLSSKGIGLKNAMSRIELLLEKEPELELLQEDAMVRSILKIPAIG